MFRNNPRSTLEILIRSHVHLVSHPTFLKQFYWKIVESIVVQGCDHGSHRSLGVHATESLHDGVGDSVQCSNVEWEYGHGWYAGYGEALHRLEGIHSRSVHLTMIVSVGIGA